MSFGGSSQTGFPGIASKNSGDVQARIHVKAIESSQDAFPVTLRISSCRRLWVILASRSTVPFIPSPEMVNYGSAEIVVGIDFGTTQVSPSLFVFQPVRANHHPSQTLGCIVGPERRPEEDPPYHRLAQPISIHRQRRQGPLHHLIQEWPNRKLGLRSRSQGRGLPMVQDPPGTRLQVRQHHAASPSKQRPAGKDQQDRRGSSVRLPQADMEVHQGGHSQARW